MKYFKYLPFLDEKDLDELVDKIMNKEVTEVPLHNLFPFISKSKLDSLIDFMIEENDEDNITKALPFLSDQSLTKVSDAVKDGSLSNFDDSKLLPFMSSSSIKELFYEKLKKAQNKTSESPEENKE